ncbi:MAG: response regulator [Candidatus Omnitrophota bacterium]
MEFHSQIPELDLADGPEMLRDFSRESQRNLMSARNALLVLDSIPTDKEAIENLYKTIHAIRGFADFLQCHDIYHLTDSCQELIGQVRRKTFPFKHPYSALIKQVVATLQKLFELLDVQIDQHGVPPDNYPNIEDQVNTLRRAARGEDVVLEGDTSPEDFCEISFMSAQDIEEEAMQSLRNALQASGDEVAVNRTDLEQCLTNFNEILSRLNNASQCVQLRQNELIRERELAMRLTQKAQDEARAKGDYLAHMSHEIRTLINAILGFADVVRVRCEPDSRQAEHLNTIILSGKMLLEIVNNILDFSKVESGKLKLEEIPFDLSQVIEDVFQIIRTRLEGKPINLAFFLDENVPRNLIGDPTRLKQIFINLLDNGIKFTDKGEIVLNVSLPDQSSEHDGCFLSFTIRDTGIGIPRERADTVFDSYSQVDPSTTRLYGGSGLGLALCKAFVQAMDGEISVSSELGSGTAFTFKIPFQISAQEERLQLPDLPLDSAVLITPFQSTAVSWQDLCERYHIQDTAVYTNLKQAAESLEDLAHKPAAIIVDMQTGGGVKPFIKKILQQEHFAAAKLFILTPDVRFAHCSSELAEKADGIFYKPFIGEEFIRTIRMAFRSIPHYSETANGPEGEDFSKIDILAVEDSIPNQELLKIHFEELGCSCIFAGNGREAVELLKERDFDICFMDLQMPVMNGIEAAQLIRHELGKTLPIIALTAAEMDEEHEQCLEAGMSDYLAKPFDQDQLKEKLRKFTANTGVHDG